MKVPKKILNVISSVQRHKKIPGFIYNLPDELRQEIISSQKNAIVIDAFEVHSNYHVLNAVAKALELNPGLVRYDAPLLVKIEERIGDKIVIINRAEYLAVKAYSQIKEFAKSKIPVLILSSYKGFNARFRETKFYRENNFLDFNCDEIK